MAGLAHWATAGREKGVGPDLEMCLAKGTDSHGSLSRPVPDLPGLFGTSTVLVSLGIRYESTR